MGLKNLGPGRRGRRPKKKIKNKKKKKNTTKIMVPRVPQQAFFQCRSSEEQGGKRKCKPNQRNQNGTAITEGCGHRLCNVSSTLANTSFTLADWQQSTDIKSTSGTMIKRI